MRLFMNKIGICGTGKMGKEIGKRLLDCDQTITAWNRTKNKVTPLVELGAIRANSVKELFPQQFHGHVCSLYHSRTHLGQYKLLCFNSKILTQ